MRREVEDVAEVIHQIQSWLPVTEAARTSVLSKSWLHAWSTIPTLSFDLGSGKSMKLEDVDRTLIRYLRDNIPIESFDLTIDIENQDSASHAEKWIRNLAMATKTDLKEFSLSVIFLYGASFTLPDEILSVENLTKIRVSASPFVSMTTRTSQHPVIIKCGSLRELHLDDVCINEEVLHDILSSCSLLEKIVLLHCCKGFKTIKVKNLHRLYELRIAVNHVYSTALEISHVPNLGVFSYGLDWSLPETPLIPFNAHSISLGSSNVTQLTLDAVIADYACLDVIKSGFPFLECLTLGMTSWMLASFHFTCASIKMLSLRSCLPSLIDVQVYAPNLLFFEFDGQTLPSTLLFPVSSLEETNVSLSVELPVDANFFLKLRETLTLSLKCYLRITTFNFPKLLSFDIDMDDLRTRLIFPPATNVEEVWFETVEDECQWERSPFFDAFFEISHPKHVYALPDSRFRDNNHFCWLMLREVLETRTAYWPHYLKHVQIRESHHQNWKTLTNSQRSNLAAPDVHLYFKLKWR